MRRSTPLIVLAAVALATWLALPRASADAGDDTLRYYLERSDVVVDATIRSLDGPWYGEAGVANYGAAMEIHAYVKGTLPPPPPEAVEPGKEALRRATIVRFEWDDADRLPYLKTGARVVLFLKRRPDGSVPAHETSDFWFGVQPYGPWLVRRLGEILDPPDRSR